jgi:iron(III) transport system ATP-binding protein
MTTMAKGIRFERISKRYGEDATAPFAVRDISFEVPTGTLTTILGPSGCGKTTTLRMIAGLESPTEGRIFIDGIDVTALGPSERNVSMVFQSYALFPHMNVVENVAFGLRMSGQPKAQALARAVEALRSVGLVGFDERLPGELSGGQQQRVALARALVLEPAVLLFDEPLSNLDARLRREMREEIRMLQQRLKLTVAYVTHDQNEALAVSDHIIVMDHGVIAQRGTPQELYERPRTPFVAGFMGEAMLFDAQPDGPHAVRVGPLRIESREPVDGAAQVAIRPEAWQIGPAGSGLAARVTKAAYLGHAYEYTFETALGPIFVVWPQVQAPLSPGMDAGLTLAAHGVAIVPAQSKTEGAPDAK